METITCTICGIPKPLSEFRKYPDRELWRKQCKSCESIYSKEYNKTHRQQRATALRTWRHNTGMNQPMNENKKCSNYLGVHIAERILSHYFEDVIRTKYGTKGYDFICKKGMKIDVKSACIKHYSIYNIWQFHIRHNTTADYFLCLAFDSRDSLEPQHIWLIPGNIINHLDGFSITDSLPVLKKWEKYEKDLTKVHECCNAIRK